MSNLISRFIKSTLLRRRLLAGDLPILERRQRMESSVRWLRPAKGVQVSPIIVGGQELGDPVPAEWIEPADPSPTGVLYYIHGGAFVVCSVKTHRPLVSRLAKTAGVRALSLDYRLAPEHPFPAALEDCLTGYRWLMAEGFPTHQILVAGDSAGGNLTLAMMLALKQAREPLPAAALCLSPVTDLAGTGESIVTKAKVDPILDPAMAHNLVLECYVKGHDEYDPLISPLYGDLSGLPPILLHVGEDEILLDDSVRFSARARSAGVDVQLVIWPGMWHVFHVFAPFVPEANQAIEQAGVFIKRMTNNPG